jgi:hypothetical protein
MLVLDRLGDVDDPEMTLVVARRKKIQVSASGRGGKG